MPKDTSVGSETINYVSRSGFMSYFIFEYLERNRSQFKGMTFKEFTENYTLDESLSKEFIEYARFNEAQINLTGYESRLEKALKANIAQQLFGPNAYEFILNQSDPMLKKVLEIEQKSKEANGGQ